MDVCMNDWPGCLIDAWSIYSIMSDPALAGFTTPDIIRLASYPSQRAPFPSLSAQRPSSPLRTPLRPELSEMHGRIDALSGRSKCRGDEPRPQGKWDGDLVRIRESHGQTNTPLDQKPKICSTGRIFAADKWTVYIL